METAVAFLQARASNRDVFVNTPKEDANRSTYWQLAAAACGLPDSVQVWHLTSDDALADRFRRTGSKLETTFYFKHSAEQVSNFIFVRHVNNYLFSGLPNATESFEAFFQKEFGVEELDCSTFLAFGSEIDQFFDDSIFATLSAKVNSIDTARLGAYRKNNGDVPASASDVRFLRRDLNQMLYVDRTANHILLYFAPIVARKTS